MSAFGNGTISRTMDCVTKCYNHCARRAELGKVCVMTQVKDIIVVEDDTDIRTMVVELLSKQGWSCAGVGSADALDRLRRDYQAKLLVLDINLPGEDGLGIAKRVSSEENPPAILMLTARSDDIDRIIGLELGADDYLGKPFNPRELVARARALLRRINRLSNTDDAKTLHVAGYAINTRARSVTRENGETLALSGAEFALFVALAEAKGRILSRDYLLDHIHGREAAPFDRSIDVLVSRLRKKVDGPDKPSIIEGVRNAGYVIREDPL